MVVKTTELPENIGPSAVSLVEGTQSSFDMLDALKSASHTDVRVLCVRRGGHVFNVHRVIVERSCTYFKHILAGMPEDDTRVVLAGDKPAMVARAIYFLYTNTYPKSHIALTGVKDFATLSDDYYMQGREDLLHAAMYATGIKFGIPDLAATASKAFRNLGQGNSQFLKSDCWMGMTTYIYKSTPDTERDLRNIVVRELQCALRYERSLIKSMSGLADLLVGIPSLARDLALMPLSNQMYSCGKCWQKHYILLLPCGHAEEHEADDKDCAKLNRAQQECFKCHLIGVLTEPWIK